MVCLLVIHNRSPSQRQVHRRRRRRHAGFPHHEDDDERCCPRGERQDGEEDGPTVEDVLEPALVVVARSFGGGVVVDCGVAEAGQAVDYAV